MDSIFEEGAEEVGGEIEAYCPSPRCKADTTHTIIYMYEDEIRRVQCVVCGEVHAYRKPRGDGTGEDGEGGSKAKSAKRLTWDEAMSRASDTDLGNCRPYSIRDTYEEGDVVHHPVFDIGFVVEQLPDNKVEVIFRDGGSRILVHNRGDLAARMPEIAEVPMPREQKKKKRAKKPESATPVPQRSKAEVEDAVNRARSAAQTRMEEGNRAADERSKKLKADAKTTKGKGGKAPAPAPAAKGAAPAGKGAAPAAKGAAPAAKGAAPAGKLASAGKAVAAAAGKAAAAINKVAAAIGGKGAGKAAAPAKGAAKAAPAKAAPAKAAAPAKGKPAKAAPAAKGKAAAPAKGKAAAPAKKPAAKPAKAAKPAAKKPAAKPAKKPAKPAGKKKK